MFTLGRGYPALFSSPPIVSFPLSLISDNDYIGFFRIVIWSISSIGKKNMIYW